MSLFSNSKFDPNAPTRWRVEIRRPPWGITIDFYVYRLIGHDIEVLTIDGGEHKVLRMKEGELVPKEPTFRFGGIEATQMMSALAEALEHEGIKTPNDFKVQGLLEATKFHLTDLRHLLKLPSESK